MGKRNQVIAATAANIGSFGLGTALAWTSPAFESMQDKSEHFKDVSANTKTWIAASLPLGALVSVPICGILMHVIGRRDTILLLSVPFVLGWLMVGYSTSVLTMLLGRFTSGFCGGGFSLVTPIYVGEIAEKDIRGALGCEYQLFVVLGILFVNVIGILFDWQWMSIICGFGPLVFLVFMIFVPDSPVKLIIQGDREEAFKALAWFRKTNDKSQVEIELDEIERNVASLMESSKTGFPKFNIPNDFLGSRNLKPIIICFVLALFQQLSGINSVIFYTTQIFAYAGSSIPPNHSSIIVASVQVVSTLLPIILVDKVGRKPLLVLSCSLMCVSSSVMGWYFSKQQNTESGNGFQMGWLPLVCLMSFISAYSCGLGPLPWVLMGELLPTKLKVLISSGATILNWLGAFGVTKFYSDMDDAVGSAWCYWIFATVCGLTAVFCAIMLPETKRKSLRELSMLF